MAGKMDGVRSLLQRTGETIVCDMGGRITLIPSGRSDYPFSLMLDTEGYGLISLEKANDILRISEVAQAQKSIDLKSIPIWRRYHGLSQAPFIDLGGTLLVAFNGNLLQTRSAFFALVGPTWFPSETVAELHQAVSAILRN